MRKNKKLDFLLTVCLTLEIGGLIALFVGIVLKLFAAMFGGAISVICACLIILLNADENRVKNFVNRKKGKNIFDI